LVFRHIPVSHELTHYASCLVVVPQSRGEQSLDQLYVLCDITNNTSDLEGKIAMYTYFCIANAGSRNDLSLRLECSPIAATSLWRFYCIMRP